MSVVLDRARPRRLARNHGFQMLWTGEGVSFVGNSTASILLPLLAVTEFEAGPGWMGLLTAAAWVPWLVIGLPAGAWVDGWSARRVLIVSDLVAAATAASVPLAWVVGVLTMPHLLAVALAGGVCSVFFKAAYPKVVSGVVHPDDLESAQARLVGTEQAARLAGPSLGGAITQAVGAAYGLLLDAVSFLVSAACLWWVRPAEREPNGAAEPLGQRIREGVRVVLADPLLRWFMVIGGVSNFGLTGMASLEVLFLLRDVGLQPAYVGLLLSAAAIGGIVGAATAPKIAARLGNGRALLVLHLVAGPTALLLPLAGPGPRAALVVFSLGFVGYGVVAGNVVRAAFWQRYVPERLMARTFATAQLVVFGTMPIAALVAGALGGTLGLRGTIAVMAGIHCGAAMSVLLSPALRMRHLPARMAR